MKIKLNEIVELKDYMSTTGEDQFMSDIEESEDYMEVINDITIDMKHIIADWLTEAIGCGFDEEILINDCGIPEDIVKKLCLYKTFEIEFG